MKDLDSILKRHGVNRYEFSKMTHVGYNSLSKYEEGVLTDGKIISKNRERFAGA